MGLTVSVTHDPPETAKWDPIARRLFSQISRNWAGEPLSDIDKAPNFIRTTTKLGLAVTTHLDVEIDEKGIKVTDTETGLLNLAKHELFGRWNYTLHLGAPQQLTTSARIDLTRSQTDHAEWHAGGRGRPPPCRRRL